MRIKRVLVSLRFLPFTGWIACVLIVAASTQAFAGEKKRGTSEEKIRRLQRDAMEQDYLGTRFSNALRKLNEGVKKCQHAKCSLPLLASLYRDRGVVEVGRGQGKKGISQFVLALKVDPSIQLDPDTKTPELEAVFEQARSRVSPHGVGPAHVNSSVEGDFEHQPAAVQQIRIPVPVYIKSKVREFLKNVLVKYKGPGMTEWESIPLSPMQGGYGGFIPCTATMDVGTLSYYLQGFNKQGDPVAMGGDREHPYQVSLTEDVDASFQPPHLPGRIPLGACTQQTDCPPGFPGCQSDASPASGNEDDHSLPDGNPSTPREARNYPRFWASVFGSVDFLLLKSQSDACLLEKAGSPRSGMPFQGGSYYCTLDGKDYPPRGDVDPTGVVNASIQQGKEDSVSRGLAMGNPRISVSIEYAAALNILVGARVGYTFNTYPGLSGQREGFAPLLSPISLEGRGTYILDSDGVLSTTIAPYFFLGGGIQEMSASQSITVITTQSDGSAQPQKVQAWGVGGPGFITIGTGLRWSVGKSVAFMLAPLKGTLAFGRYGMMPAITPEFGIQTSI
ncbi:hypothetical protein [Pajaroellobacter abortibovis]|uniref:Bacterial surface antigen (D15) domain-containing protein n=1 Tax=Pajaroellobacter abortibovis TaxID=1882918 RepID=A0A1L6MWR0_9BACT|nr:hypothetical protein [Pajaroellobacter abortibovis]APR99858.1 hypothetical protein BCY86_03580 [Pajaroellobacter abortibovis]